MVPVSEPNYVIAMRPGRQTGEVEWKDRYGQWWHEARYERPTGARRALVIDNRLIREY
jgi:hypothetical protein